MQLSHSPFCRLKKTPQIKSKKIRKNLHLRKQLQKRKNKVGRMNFFTMVVSSHRLNLNLDMAMHMKCQFFLLNMHTAALGYFTDCIHISLPKEWLKSQKPVKNITLTFCYIIIYSAFHLRKTPLNVISSSSS